MQIAIQLIGLGFPLLMMGILGFVASFLFFFEADTAPMVYGRSGSRKFWLVCMLANVAFIIGVLLCADFF